MHAPFCGKKDILCRTKKKFSTQVNNGSTMYSTLMIMEIFIFNRWVIWVDESCNYAIDHLVRLLCLCATSWDDVKNIRTLKKKQFFFSFVFLLLL